MATPTSNSIPAYLVAISGDNRIASLEFGTKWGSSTPGTGVALTYSFPTDPTAFKPNYGIDGSNEPGGFSALTASQQAGAINALAAWAHVADVTFTLSADNTTTVGEIRFGRSTVVDSDPDAAAYAFLPSSAPEAGDVWLSPTRVGETVIQGYPEYLYLLHEIGHALGLKHSFETTDSYSNATLPFSTDYLHYTIMSYTALPGQQYEYMSMFPTTPMLYDVLAIQYLYGANMSWHTGNDTYVYSGSGDYFETIWDAGGTDTIQYISSSGGVIDLREGNFSQLGQPIYYSADGTTIAATRYDTVALAYGAQIENAIGGSGGDTIHGNSLGNVIDGGAGADGIYGNEGNDAIFAGSGSDYVSGGEGNDTLVGNSDIFAQQADTLDGGNGNDIIYAEYTDSISGGAGTDFLYQVNSYAMNINLGSTGIEWMQADFGNDIINAASQSVSVEVYASGGNDTLTGSNFNDIFWAGANDDIVNGNDGADVIVGDLGADTLSGGNGNDRIYADSSDASINGGAGFDAVYIAGGSGMSVDMAATGFEWAADFVGGDDTLDGSGLSVNMEAYAAGGTDSVAGGSGSDFLWGGAGNDVVTGNNGNDTLVGETGADILTGGAGIDALYANSGGGADGAQDIFVFGAGWGTDFVFDFENGIDKFDMTALGITYSDLAVTSAGAHARISYAGNLISVANAAGQVDQSDFIFV